MKKFGIKFMAVLLIVLMCFGMAACGGNKEDGEQYVPKGDDNKPVVNFQYYLAGYGRKYMDELVSTFNRKSEAGEYDFYVQGTGIENLSSSFTNSLVNTQYGGGVTAFAIVEELNYNLLGERGYLLDMTDSVYKQKVNGDETVEDRVPERLQDVYGARGKYYALNYVGGVGGIVYNKKYFEKYNFTVPQTMAEMSELLDKINGIDVNTDGSKNNDKYGMVYPAAAINYFDYLKFPFFAQMLGTDGYYELTDLESINENNIADFDNVYSTVYDNISRFAFDQGNHLTSANTHSLALTAFMRGTAFMTLGGDWSYNEMVNLAATNNEVELAFMDTPLVCDKDGKVVAKPATLQEVYGNIDRGNASAVAEAEKGYFKIEKSKVASSVITAEYASEDYVLFPKMAMSTSGKVSAAIPSMSEYKEQAAQFITYLMTDEALNIYMKYTNSPVEAIYEYDEETVTAMNDFTKKVVEVNRYSTLISQRSTHKGVSYGLISMTTGEPGDVYSRLLKPSATGADIFENIRSQLVASLKTLDANITAYENAYDMR